MCYILSNRKKDEICEILKDLLGAMSENYFEKY